MAKAQPIGKKTTIAGQTWPHTKGQALKAICGAANARPPQPRRQRLKSRTMKLRLLKIRTLQLIQASVST